MVGNPLPYIRRGSQGTHDTDSPKALMGGGSQIVNPNCLQIFSKYSELMGMTHKAARGWGYRHCFVCQVNIRKTISGYVIHDSGLLLKKRVLGYRSLFDLVFCAFMLRVLIMGKCRRRLT